MEGRIPKNSKRGGRAVGGVVPTTLVALGGRGGSRVGQGGCAAGGGKKGRVACDVGASVRVWNPRLGRGGAFGKQNRIDVCRNLLQTVLDCLEVYDQSRKEEHKVFIATLNQLHYF